MNIEIPVWKKQNLTIPEASAYSGIGQVKLYQITDDEDCGFVLRVGTRKLIKKKRFDEFINTAYSI